MPIAAPFPAAEVFRMSEPFAHLAIERTGAVATLCLDRPDKLNALNRALWHSIPEAVATLDRDPGVRAIVLTGKGKAFCAGIDLLDHAPGLARGGSLSGIEGSAVAKRRQLYDDIRAYQRTASCFAGTNKPVIAAVHGACLGGGVDLITACDIRLAAADAVFSVRETRIAMVADIGSLQRLPRVIGDGHAREWIFTGADYDAERAREIGLVNAVLPDREAVLARAMELARAIAANSPLAVQGAKHVLGFASRREVDGQLDYVALWNAAFLHSEDLGEAMQAFMEKRPPQFKGQ
jgi:enoyl-CoA hydratase